MAPGSGLWPEDMLRAQRIHFFSVALRGAPPFLRVEPLRCREPVRAARRRDPRVVHLGRHAALCLTLCSGKSPPLWHYAQKVSVGMRARHLRSTKDRSNVQFDLLCIGQPRLSSRQFRQPGPNGVDYRADRLIGPPTVKHGSGEACAMASIASCSGQEQQHRHV